MKTNPGTPLPEARRRCPICSLVTSADLCPTDRVSTLLVDGSSLGVSSLSVGSILGGRYAIERLIGKGGFGSVFQARHTGTGQDVAIKTLGAGLESDDLALRRFFQEARVTAGLRHPNTIRVFDFGQEESGMLFLAMEMLTGVTLKLELKNRLRQNKVFTEREAIDIGDAVTRSLAEAHAAGLVHRDLKPDNIFLHRIDNDDVIVKVLDFGIVKLANSSLTMGSDSGVPGTPAYMSPEQVSKKEIDGRSDLYSLGVVLYSMVTGNVPFRGQDALQTLYMHVHEPVPDVRDHAKTPISEAFANVLMKVLAKNPTTRPQDAREMRAMLQSCLDGRHSGSLGVKLASQGALPRADSSPPAITMPVTPGGTDPSLSLGRKPLQPAFFDGLLASDASEPATETPDDNTHPSVSGYPSRKAAAAQSDLASAALEASNAAEMAGRPRRATVAVLGLALTVLAIAGGLFMGRWWSEEPAVVSPVAATVPQRDDPPPAPIVTPAPAVAAAPTPAAPAPVSASPAAAAVEKKPAEAAPKLAPAPVKKKAAPKDPEKNEVLDLKI